MRLRLEVLRYQLPPTKILWQASAEQTIADLLHSLDPFVPLESQNWGLEDYILETPDGFETLHFQTVGSILKEDDHVKIRPLSTNDIRARRLTGRTQIHGSGARLTDGVVYGRPLLRKPIRPEIHIESRARLGYGSAGSNAPEALALYPPEDELENAHSYDFEDDWNGVNLGGEGLEEEDSEEESLEEGESSYDAGDSEDMDYGYDEGDQDNEHDEEVGDEDDDEEIPEGTVITVHGAKQNNTRLSKRLAVSQSANKSSNALVLHKGTRDKRVRWKDNDGPDSQPRSDNDISSSGSLDGTNSSEAVNDPVAGVSATETGPPAKRLKTSHGKQTQSTSRTIPPGRGTTRTRSRNQRRAVGKKLAYLKAQRRLPEDADKRQLGEFLKARTKQPPTTPPNARDATSNVASNVISSSPESDDSESESECSSSEATSSSTGSSSGSESCESDDSRPSLESSKREVASPHSGEAREVNGKKISCSDEILARRDALLASLANGGIDVSDPAAPSADAAAADKAPEIDVMIEKGSSLRSPENVDGRKKSKLNIRATERLLLGALGHRVPKSPSERAALTAKVDAQAKKKQPRSLRESADTIDAVPSSAKPSSTDPNFWKSRIELTAVECCEDNIQLSTPPFPFYQRWDPSQNRKRSGKRKRDHNAHEYVNYYEEPHLNDEAEESIVLNYDDPIEENGQAEHSVDEFDGFLDDDVNLEDDLPAVPDDLSTLPLVTEAELRTGDVLVFTNLEATAATKWAPEQSSLRTAKIINNEIKMGDMLLLQLAQRDLPQRKYDEEGNRIYEKFDMNTGEDDHGEGVLELSFVQLMEPRLLARDS